MGILRNLLFKYSFKPNTFTFQLNKVQSTRFILKRFYRFTCTILRPIFLQIHDFTSMFLLFHSFTSLFLLGWPERLGTPYHPKYTWCNIYSTRNMHTGIIDTVSQSELWQVHVFSLVYYVRH